MNDSTDLDDAGWSHLVEQLDLRVGDLSAAEARLRTGGEAPLSPSMAAAMVRRATGSVSVLHLRETGAHRWSRAAALLLGAALLTAGTAFLVWSGRDSRLNMSYQEQLHLLESPEQPEEHRRSALAHVASRVGRGILTLQNLREDSATPPALVEGARLGMARLLTLLTVEPPRRLGAFYENIDRAGDRARDAGLALDDRARELERLILAIGSDIGAIKSMPGVSTSLGVARASHTSKLQSLLAH